VTTAVIDPTLPPRYVMDSYKRAFAGVHGREPVVRYMGNHWYHVNGETVHRLTLIEEISRLRELGQVVERPRPEKSLIQRLIAGLRRL
jgi:hypothetical protein